MNLQEMENQVSAVVLRSTMEDPSPARTRSRLPFPVEVVHLLWLPSSPSTINSPETILDGRRKFVLLDLDHGEPLSPGSQLKMLVNVKGKQKVPFSLTGK